MLLYTCVCVCVRMCVCVCVRVCVRGEGVGSFGVCKKKFAVHVSTTLIIGVVISVSQ